MSFTKVQPKIQQWVEEDPSRLRDIITFVSLTIRQPFYHMHRQMTSVREYGFNSPYLFGFKKKTYQWLVDNTGKLDSFHSAIKSLPDVDGLAMISTIPGIGVTKAGFVLQMTKGSVGCLDTHNLVLYKDIIKGIIKDDHKYNNIFKSKFPKWEPLGYTLVCNHLGSEYLWDQWCSFISHKYPTRFMSSTHVSEFHYECLVN